MSESKKDKPDKPDKTSPAEMPPTNGGNGNGNGHDHIITEGDTAIVPARVITATKVELPIHRRVDTSFLQYASYVIRDRAIRQTAAGGPFGLEWLFRQFLEFGLVHVASQTGPLPGSRLQGGGRLHCPEWP